jgi:hypothetical protein
MVFAMNLNLSDSFINVPSPGPMRPTCAIDATDWAEPKGRPDIQHREIPGSGQAARTQKANAASDAPGDGPASDRCEEGSSDSGSFAISKQFNGVFHPGRYKFASEVSSDSRSSVMSNVWNLSWNTYSEIYESAECYAAGQFPIPNRFRISITFGSFGLDSVASVFTLACPFGSSDRHFSGMDPAQVLQIQSTKVVWTILGIVVGISLPIISGIVLFCINHSRHSSETMSETESEVEIPGGILASLSNFEIFLSEENGLTGDSLFSVQNEAKGANGDESSFVT